MRGDRGAALTLAIVIVMILSTLAAVALALAYNYRMMRDGLTAQHARAHFRAQAGVVDARWRIRNNFGMDFTVAANDPAPYDIDIDGDGTNDVTVDIGPADGNGLRPIQSVGAE